MTPQQSNAEMLSAYLDDELGDVEREALENLLRESPETREELAELRRVVQLVGNLPPIDAPPDLYDQVARKIRRRQALHPENARTALLSVAFQVLSILVILTIATLYMMAQLDGTPRAIDRASDLEPIPELQP